jgi:hypothetical protein
MGAVALIIVLGFLAATVPAPLADSIPTAGPSLTATPTLTANPGLATPPDGGRPTLPETLIPLGSRAAAPQIQTSGVPREFYFSRVAYNGYRGFYRGGGWATDYPKADQIFLSFIDRLLPNLDAYEREFVVQLPDPDIRHYPFLYMLEVGGMALTPPERQGLRDYLLSGGFLVIDDFWGTREWMQFEYEIRQVLPEFEIVDMPIEHPIFTAFYEIEEIIQVPNVNNGVYGGRTDEGDNSEIPMVKGIHDEKGRLMVIINFNTDLGDAWEWADNPQYPLRYSTYAYEMGVNFIVYAMSH